MLTSCTGSLQFHVGATLSDIVDEAKVILPNVPPSANVAFTNGPSASANYVVKPPKNLTGPIAPR
jgi:hypothetical protein